MKTDSAMALSKYSRFISHLSSSFYSSESGLGFQRVTPGISAEFPNIFIERERDRDLWGLWLIWFDSKRDNLKLNSDKIRRFLIVLFICGCGGLRSGSTNGTW